MQRAGDPLSALAAPALNVLLSSLAAFRRREAAEALFRGAAAARRPSAESYGCLLAAYAAPGALDAPAAQGALKAMAAAGIAPNARAYR